MSARDVELVLDQIGGKGTFVVIAGQDVTRLARGVNLVSGVGELTKLVIDLAPSMVRASVQCPVAVDSATHELLVELGWTPPAGGEL